MAEVGPAKRLLFRAALGVYGAALAVGARLPWKYSRFLALHARADRLVERDPRRAAAFARELLELAERYRADWNYGNAIHKGHLILGRVALRRGDLDAARRELLLAGRTPGSPQLDSFGPNMTLAKELLKAGEKGVVLEYFELCRRFWVMGAQHLAYWVGRDQRIARAGFRAKPSVLTRALMGSRAAHKPSESRARPFSPQVTSGPHSVHAPG